RGAGPLPHGRGGARGHRGHLRAGLARGRRRARPRPRPGRARAGSLVRPMKDSVYLTTPIYYVNSTPHIGTAYTTVVGDTLARYHRARGRNVFLATGTDEHGQKVEESALAAGVAPKTFVDGITAKFRATWKNLLISEDRFIRTTDPDHAPVVVDLWKRMEAEGDIYFMDEERCDCVCCAQFY